MLTRPSNIVAYRQSAIFSTPPTAQLSSFLGPSAAPDPSRRPVPEDEGVRPFWLRLMFRARRVIGGALGPPRPPTRRGFFRATDCWTSATTVALARDSPTTCVRGLRGNLERCEATTRARPGMSAGGHDFALSRRVFAHFPSRTAVHETPKNRLKKKRNLLRLPRSSHVFTPALAERLSPIALILTCSSEAGQILIAFEWIGVDGRATSVTSIQA